MDNHQSSPTLGLVEVDYGEFEFYEKCGGGAYGSVYRAGWKSKDTIVAVKKVLVLEKEAQVLSILSHKNIIQFYGAVTKPPNYCLVMEYATEGSLYSFLSSHQGDNMLSYEKILFWALDIARGMNYLHTEAPVTVIHRDLKSKNVVLTSDYVCKLCDFGASRFHGSTTKMSLAGTIPWMAPEVIQSLPTSAACDIWSYGVVLWELLTHEIPFKGIEGFQIAWLVVEKDERLVIPSTCPAPLGNLMKMSWQKEPRKRPSFVCIIEQLQAFQRDDDIEASYLKERSLWKFEIEETFSRIQNMERDLDIRQKELQEWERRLEEKEQSLERQQYLQKLNSHDVNMWTEDDVNFWFQQVVKQEHKKDLARYVPLFPKHNISGRSLLKLNQDDFRQMGIISIGHIKTLNDEIEQLNVHNTRMLDFPPLENTIFEPMIGSVDMPASRVKLILMFGSHIRRGAHESEHKWKMYAEVDENDNPAAIGCIKKVAFRFQETEQIIQQAPFVMERWYTGIHDDTIVDCTVFYQSFVKKPKHSRYRHKIRLENCKVHQREVTLLFKPTISLQKAQAAISRPMTPNRNTASPILMGAWQSRSLISHSPVLRTSPNAGMWAKVVSGRKSSLNASPANGRKSSLTASPASSRKTSLPATTSSPHLDVPLVQRAVSDPVNTPPSSRRKSRDKRGGLLKAIGMRTKHRRGSKVKWQQKQLNGNSNDSALPAKDEFSSSDSGSNTISDADAVFNNSKAVNGQKTDARRLNRSDSGFQKSPESLRQEPRYSTNEHKSWSTKEKVGKIGSKKGFSSSKSRKISIFDKPNLNDSTNGVSDISEALEAAKISCKCSENGQNSNVASDKASVGLEKEKESQVKVVDNPTKCEAIPVRTQNVVKVCHTLPAYGSKRVEELARPTSSRLPFRRNGFRKEKEKSKNECSKSKTLPRNLGAEAKRIFSAPKSILKKPSTSGDHAEAETTCCVPEIPASVPNKREEEMSCGNADDGTAAMPNKISCGNADDGSAAMPNKIVFLRIDDLHIFRPGETRDLVSNASNISL
uniref:Mitogen-activated protein kinase kinase kinase n=1 Tax=Strigamia maritima TaxID=126957 RepID=T1JAY9_STRMM